MGTVGLPTGRQPYGNGAAIVVREQESCSHGEGRQVLTITKEREVREMRNAETILGIIHECGRQGLPLEDLYRQLFKPTLYLLAYGKIYRNDGAMTRGTTAETVDGMSLEKIQGIIETLRACFKNHTMLLAKRLTISRIIASCSSVSFVCTLRS
jgi:hypothetical protein